MKNELKVNSLVVRHNRLFNFIVKRSDIMSYETDSLDSFLLRFFSLYL